MTVADVRYVDRAIGFTGQVAMVIRMRVATCSTFHPTRKSPMTTNLAAGVRPSEDMQVSEPLTSSHESSRFSKFPCSPEHFDISPAVLGPKDNRDSSGWSDEPEERMPVRSVLSLSRRFDFCIALPWTARDFDEAIPAPSSLGSCHAHSLVPEEFAHFHSRQWSSSGSSSSSGDAVACASATA